MKHHSGYTFYRQLTRNQITNSKTKGDLQVTKILYLVYMLKTTKNTKVVHKKVIDLKGVSISHRKNSTCRLKILK